MSESATFTPPAPPAPTESTIEMVTRLRALREQWLALRLEVRAAQKDSINFPRQHVYCLRCGYNWDAYDPFVPPITCARCGSTSWMLPPTARSRRPSDPPSPSWRTRKGRRRAKVGDTVLRYRVDQPPRTRKVKVAPTPKAPWELEIMTTAIPPPPDPTASMPLSERFAYYLDHPYEEQPERVTSHLAPPPSPTYSEQADIPIEVDHTPYPFVDVLVVAEEVIPTDPEPSADDNPAPPAPPADVPPETVGTPRTEAEREELAKSKEEIWPTTRGE
jgi:hypothetical protein